MSLFIILSSETISFICFESYRTLWTKAVIVLSDMLFTSIVENKSFCVRHSYSDNSCLFTFIADFSNSSRQRRLSQVFTLLIAVYICPGPNSFCFLRSKSITPWYKLKPWTLWTVNAHANVKGNWVRLIDGDADPFFIGA